MSSMIHDMNHRRSTLAFWVFSSTDSTAAACLAILALGGT